ncbi:MAG: hypothetical protein AB1467_01305 [Candidatus Diapherotrites archaeon]
MIDFFKLIGALGIILIAVGILIKKRRKQDIFYVGGGVCLLIYSVYINDLIFVILQIIFTIAAIYDFVKIQSFKK